MSSTIIAGFSEEYGSWNKAWIWLRTRDGYRARISVSSLVAPDVYHFIPEKSWAREFVSTLLYDNAGVGLAKVRQTFRVIFSTPQEAAELGIRVHDPVVQVRRIFQNASRQVICLAQLLYRTDGVVFDINIDLDDRDRLLELGGVPES